jgi:hypothetical protein
MVQQLRAKQINISSWHKNSKFIFIPNYSIFNFYFNISAIRDNIKINIDLVQPSEIQCFSYVMSDFREFKTI